MIARVVLFVLMIFLGYTVFSALRRWLGGSSPDSESESDPGQMVLCVQCGTYVPQADAVRIKEKGEVCYLCDEACLEAYKKQH